MKKLLLMTVALLFSATIFAQTDSVADAKKWNNSGTAAINMTQSSFTNWAAGGANAIAGTASLAYKILYKQDKHLWETNFAGAFGFTYQDKKTRKNEDRIELNSKYGYQLKDKWYLSASLQFKSQFVRGYDSYPVGLQNYNSMFMAPGYLTLVPIAIDYVANDNFSVSYSPLSSKMTFVCDRLLSDLGAFGVDKGKRMKYELGSFLKASYQQVFAEKVVLKSKLELFSSYSNKPLNIDVNWETDITFKVFKWLSASFYSQVLYDDDIRTFDVNGDQIKGAKIQFKQVLGMGLSFIL